MRNTGLYLSKFTNATVNCLKQTTGYSAFYQGIFSCFLICIKKTTNSPRHIRCRMQTDLEDKNDTWEPENRVLEHLGSESKMKLKANNCMPLLSTRCTVTCNGYCSSDCFRILNHYETKLKNKPWHRYQKKTGFSFLSSWMTSTDQWPFSCFLSAWVN